MARGGMKQDVIILAFETYRMEDKEVQGEFTNSAKIWYLPDIDLSNLDNEAREGNISKGVKPVSESLPYSQLENIVSVPGVYELTSRMQEVTTENQFGKKKHNAIKPVCVKYIGEARLEIIDSNKVVAERKGKIK